MKKPVQTLFYSTLFILGLFTILPTSSSNASDPRIFGIRIIFGTRSHPSADGKGCEGDKGLCFIVSRNDKTMDPQAGLADIEVRDGKIFWNIVQDPEPALDYENTFYVYEDKVVPADIAQELGYSSITIRKGEYRLDKSKNRLGSILLNADFRY